MLKTATPVTDADLAEYRAGALARKMAHDALVEDRRRRAWSVAKAAADHLRAVYGASRVAVIGSLAADGSFGIRSDVDLVVWGIPPQELCRAVGELQGLEPDIAVDVIRAEEANDELLRAAETAGQPT